jgi:hypothetical protein
MKNSVLNKIGISSLIGLILCGYSFGQENQPKITTDSLAVIVKNIQADVNPLKKLKFTGFIQAQWQKADTIGSPSYNGGNFTGTDNRFNVRKARFKAVYASDNSQIALQFDLKETGVFVKEAYCTYTEPWLKTLAITGGFFGRPIGWEVEASSTAMESAERARITQTLFPDESDLGAKLTIQAPKASPYSFIKLDLGLFNGNGISPETDKYKDFIGHLSMKKSFMNDNLSLSGGFSIYNGGWAVQKNAKVFKFNSETKVFESIDNSGYEAGDKVKRNYMGFDVQASLQTVAGTTTIRCEYLWGQQPGTASSSVSPRGLVNKSSNEIIVQDTLTKKYFQVTTSSSLPSDIYLRDFSGGYIYFIQRILKTKHELVFKYDWYDPNTKVSENKIGVGSVYDATKKSWSNPGNFGSGDMKFTTIELGWNYYATNNFRVSVYYDIVDNETTTNYGPELSKDTKGNLVDNSVTNYSKDLKDNLVTLRLQYKF